MKMIDVREKIYKTMFCVLLEMKKYLNRFDIIVYPRGMTYVIFLLLLSFFWGEIW